MPIDHHQHPVAADAQQAGRSHQQPADDASLDVERVLGHLVDVGGVDHVRMHDQGVAHAGQEPRHRSGIAGMAADRGVDSGRNQEHDVEALGTLERPFAKLEDRRNRRRDDACLEPRRRWTGCRPRSGSARLDRSLEQTTNRTACSPSPSRSLHHPGEMAQSVMGIARPGKVPFVLIQPHHGKPRSERQNLRT